VLNSYPQILIPELNTGQLRRVIRSEFLLDVKGLNKVAGEPFKVAEIEEKILEMIK
jgi:2-oxoglutarate ferredoxin oxidoreductase subunit alpha